MSKGSRRKCALAPAGLGEPLFPVQGRCSAALQAGSKKKERRREAGLGPVPSSSWGDVPARPASPPHPQ